jgi:hypothetical protein
MQTLNVLKPMLLCVNKKEFFQKMAVVPAAFEKIFDDSDGNVYSKILVESSLTTQFALTSSGTYIIGVGRNSNSGGGFGFSAAASGLRGAKMTTFPDEDGGEILNVTKLSFATTTYFVVLSGTSSDSGSGGGVSTWLFGVWDGGSGDHFINFLKTTSKSSFSTDEIDDIVTATTTVGATAVNTDKLKINILTEEGNVVAITGWVRVAAATATTTPQARMLAGFGAIATSSSSFRLLLFGGMRRGRRPNDDTYNSEQTLLTSPISDFIADFSPPSTNSQAVKNAVADVNTFIDAIKSVMSTPIVLINYYLFITAYAALGMCAGDVITPTRITFFNRVVSVTKTCVQYYTSTASPAIVVDSELLDRLSTLIDVARTFISMHDSGDHKQVVIEAANNLIAAVAIVETPSSALQNGYEAIVFLADFLKSQQVINCGSVDDQNGGWLFHSLTSTWRRISSWTNAKFVCRVCPIVVASSAATTFLCFGGWKVGSDGGDNSRQSREVWEVVAADNNNTPPTLINNSSPLDRIHHPGVCVLSEGRVIFNGGFDFAFSSAGNVITAIADAETAPLESYFPLQQQSITTATWVFSAKTKSWKRFVSTATTTDEDHRAFHSLLIVPTTSPPHLVIAGGTPVITSKYVLPFEENQRYLTPPRPQTPSSVLIPVNSMTADSTVSRTEFITTTTAMSLVAVVFILTWITIVVVCFIYFMKSRK